jgi:Tol biopolymer transport system component/tRNA A-37 threonylcarbamoyl transferase component Bud32
MIGQTIGHYKITGEIGRGGMGIIYSAEDLTLGREVAIKFLSPEMGTDHETLERFRREARAASALNHPNICTIYGLEQDGERNFIVMELMEGKPLARKLVEGALKLGDVLELGTQIADALDAAHAKGIIHRDIKPANIFITSRGQAKVLDFGLAKLTQKSHHAVAETAAIGAAVRDSALSLTQSGTTVGTIAYMSPEQACGEELDGRSDLFSFGAVLYEMSTGKLPFPGNSPAVVFNEILEHAPMPPRQVNPELPERLEQIILRGLEKDRELRYQSAAEMRAELRRLARDSSSGKMQSAAPRSVAQVRAASSSKVIMDEARRHKWTIILTVLGVIAFIAAASILLYKWLGHTAVPYDTRDLKVTRLTNHGEAVYAGISPDGKYVAYARRQGDRSLWVKAVNTGSHIQVIPPGPGFYQADISFTPDGDYVCFAHHSFDGSGVIDLYSVPTLGGAVRKIVADVGSGATFSPDGKKITFVRFESGRSLLMVANADGSGQQQLAERKSSEGFISSAPSWSPDGRLIAAAAGHFGKDALTEVAVYPVAGGKPTAVLTKLGINAVRWLTDAGFLLMAVDYTHGTRNQLYYQPYPSGEMVRFTSDLNSYQSISLDAQQNILAAVQVDSNNNLYIAPVSDPNAMRQVTRDRDLGSAVTWISNTRLAVQDPELHINLLDADGGNRDDMASGLPAGSPARCGENGLVVERLEANNVVNIWYFNLGDGSSHRLSNGNLNTLPDCSPDGKWAYFISQDVSPSRIMKVAVSGGEPTALGPPAFRAAASPDGNYVVATIAEGQGTARRDLFAVLRASDGEVVQRWPVPVGAVQQFLAWTPDSKSFVFDILRGGNANLWLQRLDAKEPRQLTNLPALNDYITGAAFSPDGKQLAIVHGAENVDVLLFTNFRK